MIFLVNIIVGFFVGWFLHDIISLYIMGFTEGFSTWHFKDWCLWVVWALAFTYILSITINSILGKS